MLSNRNTSTLDEIGNVRVDAELLLNFDYSNFPTTDTDDTEIETTPHKEPDDKITHPNNDSSSDLIHYEFTQDQIFKASPAIVQILGDKDVCTLLKMEGLSLDQVLGLSNAASSALCNQCVKDFIHKKMITIDAVCHLKEAASNALCNEDVQKRILKNSNVNEETDDDDDDGKSITIDNILTFSDAINNALASEGAWHLKDLELLTIDDEIINLSDAASRIICDSTVMDMLETNAALGDYIGNILDVTEQASQALLDEYVQDLIQDREVPIDAIFNITVVASDALCNDVIQPLLSNRYLDIDDILDITPEIYDVLCNDFIRELLSNRHLDSSDILDITPETYDALCDPANRALIAADPYTVQLILHSKGEVIINTSQSIHTTSVHEDASNAALKLMKQYGLQIVGNGLEKTIGEFKTYIKKLDTDRNKAAARCIERMTAPDFNFVDPVSKVGMKQLLALCFLAVQDDQLRMKECTKEDALSLLVEGLYEIQRAYNISNKGVDQGGSDRQGCAGGAFNKPIEKMSTVHQLCKEFRFISDRVATLKLPVVVLQEAKIYLYPF